MSTSVHSAPRPADAPGRLPNAQRSQTLLWGVAWALATLALAAYAYKRLFAGDLVDPDAMDFAQIARNWGSGHGYSTSIFRPLALSGFVAPATPDAVTVPDISRPPLYPFLLTVAFAAHGGHGGGTVAALTSLLFFLASAVAVFFLARRLFPQEGQPWLALLSAGLYVLGGGALGYAVSGLPVTLATLNLTLLLITLHWSHEVGGRAVPPARCFVVGMVLGLCYLTQYSLLLLVVPTLVYIYASRASSRAGLGVLAGAVGFFVITGPWLVRNALVSHGNPFFTLLLYGLMANTPDYPGPTTIYRSAVPTIGLFSYFFSHLSEMVRKAGQNLYFYQTHLLDVFSVFIIAPALAALLWRFPDPRVGVLRGYIAVCVLLLVVVTVFFAPSMQILAPFAPVLCVLACGFVFGLLSQQKWQPSSQRIAIWGWGILVGIGLLASLTIRDVATLNPVQQGITMIATGIDPPFEAALAKLEADQKKPGITPAKLQATNQLIQDVKRNKLLAHRTVITDTPWELVWRLQDRSALWLPRDNETYEAIVARSATDSEKVTASSILLTPNLSAYNATSDEVSSWVNLAAEPKLQASLNAAPKQVARITKVPPALVQRGYTLQTYRSALLKQTQDQYNSAVGPISEIVGDYSPVLRQLEDNPRPLFSTVFLRRDIVETLKQASKPSRK